MRPRIGGLRVPLVWVVLAACAAPTAAQVAAPAPPAPAADEAPSLRGGRRFLLAALGMAAGLIPALLASERDDARGVCASRACTAALGATMGGAVGFLIGRDLDRNAAVREASGPTLRLPVQPIELDLQPESVDAYEGGAVVIGREGIATVGRDQAVHKRGGAIRGIVAVAALPAYDAVLAATGTGVYSFDLSGSRHEGKIVLSEGGAALTAVAPDQVVLGGTDLIRRLRLSGRGSVLELAEEARTVGTGLSTALAFSPQAGIVWTLAGDQLVARTTELQDVGSVALPAPGRSLALSGGRALVAAGMQGLFMVDVQEPARPRVLGQIRGIRFAFDAVLTGDTAYVAAGWEGLVVVDVTNPGAARVLGVARDLGFVTSVALAPGGRIYATDREGERLLLVEPKTSGGSDQERGR